MEIDGIHTFGRYDMDVDTTAGVGADLVDSVLTAWRHRTPHTGVLNILALQSQDRMRFTSATWDTVETASLDELAFVYTAVCVDSYEWHLVHAFRGLVEDHRLRRVTHKAPG